SWWIFLVANAASGAAPVFVAHVMAPTRKAQVAIIMTGVVLLILVGLLLMALAKSLDVRQFIFPFIVMCGAAIWTGISLRNEN
ncbi:hypothetical protein, partial [Taylorella asinigenitalis]|uniref:hypothetical protein n=1 Tax=Taylorella asinigenitalis TaxID=84590 RepID=UPI00048FEF1B